MKILRKNCDKHLLLIFYHFANYCFEIILIQKIYVSKAVNIFTIELSKASSTLFCPVYVITFYLYCDSCSLRNFYPAGSG